MKEETVARKSTGTADGYLAGIGAGGAVLACVVVGFLTLVGGVSVDVWPEAGASGAPEVVELQDPPEGDGLSPAEGLIASLEVPTAPPSPDTGKRPGDDGPSAPDKSPPPDGGGAPPGGGGDGEESPPQPPPPGGDSQQGRGGETKDGDLGHGNIGHRDEDEVEDSIDRGDDELDGIRSDDDHDWERDFHAGHGRDD
jgi:hypothetical protein